MGVPDEPVVAGVSGIGVPTPAMHRAAWALCVDRMIREPRHAAVARSTTLACFEEWSERFEQLTRLGEVRKAEHGERVSSKGRARRRDRDRRSPIQGASTSPRRPRPPKPEAQ